MPTFLAPLMLYGAFAVGIPTIIHLLNRRRIKIVHWAAMDFLKDIMKKSQRILRLKDLILLLIRTLALLLLVLGVSRIACVRTGSWGGAAADIGDALFVFDTSYSMGYKISDEALFDRAKKAALKIRKSYHAGSRIQILTVGRRVTRLFKGGPTDDLVLADKAIQGLEVGSGSGNMKMLLEAAAGEVTELHHGRQDIYVFTDMQASMWKFDPDDPTYKETEAALDRVSGLFFVNCSFENVQNVAIDSVDLPDGVATADTPTQFTARVINTGTDPREDVHLGMRIYGLGDGAGGEVETGPTGAVVRDAEESEWGANAAIAAYKRVGSFVRIATIPVSEYGVSVEFEPYLFPKPGTYLVEVFVQSHDNLERDDSRFLAVQVRDSLKVLCVEGEETERGGRDRVGDTYYLRRLLAPYLKSDPDRKFPYRPVVMTADQMDRLDWIQPAESAAEPGSMAAPDDISQYSLVVLANVRDLKYEFAAALERFVGRGGALLIFLGENSDGDSTTYADLLYRAGRGLLPARLVKSFGVRFKLHKQARDMFALDTSAGQLADVMFQTGNTELTRRTTFSRPLFTKAWELVLPQDDPDLLKQPSASRPTTAPARAADEKAGEKKLKPGAGTVKGLGEDDAVYKAGYPEVVARYARGRVPFAVRRKFGKGNVILFNTTCDSTWSTLPYSAAFFMFRAAIRDLVADAAGEYDNPVCEKLVYEIPSALVAAGKTKFVFTSPKGDSEERVALAAGKDELGRERYAIEIEPSSVAVPGLYHFAPADAAAGAPGRRYFAVNIDANESALAPMEPGAEEPFFSKLGGKVIVAKYPAGISVILEAKKSVSEFSEQMLVLVLCLLVAETAVAAFMSPKSSDAPAAATRPNSIGAA